MNTFALWVWYRGTAFRGFQRQVEGPTVQQVLEEALGRVAHPSGRTDRGVHARMQVVSIRTDRFDEAAARAKLPPTEVGLVAAVPAHRSFHAQWSATGKEYRYRLALGEVPKAWADACWDTRAEDRLHQTRFDVAKFAAVLSRAQGTHDFSAFHEKSSPLKPRELAEVSVCELPGGVVEARLRGRGFARYMVRYLVGSATLVACGRLPEDAFIAAIESAEPIHGLKAPGLGLTLWEVLYPGELDPFPPELRAAAPGLPREPPFSRG